MTTTITTDSGMISTDVATNALTVDTTPPEAPGVTSLTTNDDTPVLEGTVFLWWRRPSRRFVSKQTATMISGNPHDKYSVRSHPVICTLLIGMVLLTSALPKAQADRPGLHPYIAGGIGLSRLEPDTADITQSLVDENALLANELERYGVNISNVKAKGLGETDRFQTTKTAEGCSQNRRAEVIATPGIE